MLQSRQLFLQLLTTPTAYAPLRLQGKQSYCFECGDWLKWLDSRCLDWMSSTYMLLCVQFPKQRIYACTRFCDNCNNATKWNTCAFFATKQHTITHNISNPTSADNTSYGLKREHRRHVCRPEVATRWSWWTWLAWVIRLIWIANCFYSVALMRLNATVCLIEICGTRWTREPNVLPLLGLGVSNLRVALGSITRATQVCVRILR